MTYKELLEKNNMIDPKLCKNIIDSLSSVRDIVQSNEDTFMDKFAPHADTLMGLCGVYFSPEIVKFYYILESGKHIVDSIKIEEFMEWLGTLNIENDKSKN